MEKFKFGRSLEELKLAFASGEEVLKEDEYLGDDGLPYCNKCKTRRCFVSEDEKFAMRGMCQCQEAEMKRREEEEKRQQRITRFNMSIENALIGERYRKCRFDTAVITKANHSAFEKCRNYATNYREVLRQNIGLYIYGDNSSGKTYLTACLCNELLWNGAECIYTNLASILAEIRSSYDGNGMGECRLLRQLQRYDFAFIDDLGKEFLGREFNAASSKWAEEKLFEVLNARYNAQKPTIFSSNYSIGELASLLNLDKAIVERINEMSTRVIKLEGDDFRKLVREEKSDIAKSLGI